LRQLPRLLSSVRSAESADRIYVLHKGQLVEQGSHDGLMRTPGRYAELFMLYAAAYQNGGGLAAGVEVHSES
jgi:ABC-type multidrug transport system ATPase subunit